MAKSLREQSMKTDLNWKSYGRWGEGVVVNVGKERTILVEALVFHCVEHCHMQGKMVSFSRGALHMSCETTINEI